MRISGRFIYLSERSSPAIVLDRYNNEVQTDFVYNKEVQTFIVFVVRVGYPCTAYGVLPYGSTLS